MVLLDWRSSCSRDKIMKSIQGVYPEYITGVTVSKEQNFTIV